MDRARIIVHPGAPKSATSLLQQAFADCPSVLSVGRPNQTPDYREFRDAVTEVEEWEKKRERAMAYWVKAKSMASGRPIVLSDEKLSEAPLLTVFRDRLAELVPDAKILMTVRNQFTALLSLYRDGGLRLHGVPAPYKGKYVRLGDWLDHLLKHDVVTGRQYDYGKQYQLLSERFDVTVIPYELLKSSPTEFVQRLRALIGAPIVVNTAVRVNPGLTVGAVTYLSLRQKLPRISLSSWIPWGNYLRSTLQRKLETVGLAFTEQQMAQIATAYSASNTELGRRTGIDFQRLGYPTADLSRQL
jgi:hypothetical protein